MNTAHLLQTIRTLNALDERYQLASHLANLVNSLSNLASQPTAPSHQTQVVQSFDALQTAFGQAWASLQPPQISLVDEIGGTKYFQPDTIRDLRTQLSENPATPNVAYQAAQELSNQRQSYVARISQIAQNLSEIGIEVVDLQPGEAELGILLPRDLFDNQLNGLIKELGEVEFILRGFSEAANGSIEPIEVRQISTSDPLFFFGLSVATIAMVGRVVTWALDTWKKVEEIRKIRADIQKIDVFKKDDAVSKALDEKIKDTISEAIDQKLGELRNSLTVTDEARKNEQTTHLKHALESLLARIERGMTIEVRAIAPTPESLTEDSTPQRADDFASIQAVSQELVFPKAQGTPVMHLPRSNTNGGKPSSTVETK